MGDAFELLGVEPAFVLDLAALERRHRELSRMLHPDRYAGHPPAERRQALSRAIEVNDAWRTLRDPVARAEALLHRLGLAVGEDGEPPTDPEILSQLMDLRERLATARRDRDAVVLAELRDTVRGRQTGLEQRLTRDFGRAMQPPGRAAPDEHLRATLLAELGELRYYQKFLNDVAVVEDELG